MAKIRVVVVDDSALVRSLLTEIINRQPDMQCVGAASDPLVAREMIRELNPDVITLDVMMPEQSGLTFYGAVCRDEDWKRIPVVMLSAVPISVREHAFATIGLTQGPLPAPAACLEKPCTPEALLEVVNRLVPEPTTA